MQFDPAMLAMASGGIDDSTVEYISKIRRHFEDLRQTASELAGLLVLVATGALATANGHPMLAVALETWREANDGVRSLSPPPRAAHYHQHLVRGAELLEQAFKSIRNPLGKGDHLNETIDILKSAWQQIVFATNALPGFATVDLKQSCCAMHVKNQFAGTLTL